ncbi:MAG: Cof-type HAD-IIB family hydrolase [Oscillospiraceae bacterium]|nr:Cof-type HAD-IIB family hydrolase [Oscillospiraceae bacterium]
MPTMAAFVSDLDDTLLNAEHQMTERTVLALQGLLKKGIKVVLASGRSAASVRPLVKRVGTPFPYIAFNGAQIVDAKTDQVLHAAELPEALAREVLRFFEARGVYAQFYRGDDWFWAQDAEKAAAYAHATGIIGTRAPAPLSAFLSGDAPKVLAVSDPLQVQALIAEGRRLFGDQLCFTGSKPIYVEVTLPTANKGAALARLSEMIGLDPETTFCAGDALNDMTMLQWSKHPVAVENARDEVKAMAWRVVGDGRREGIAAWLEETYAGK